MSRGNQYCTFFVDDNYFGVDVLRVQEVMRALETTPVPLAPAAVNGLINLRGQIVTSIDLRISLGLHTRLDEEAPMHVVVQTGDGAISLLVDRIGDVVTVDERMFEAPPETIPEHARSHVLGVYKFPERLLLILDIDKVVDVDNWASTR